MRILQVYDLSGLDGPGNQMARLRHGLEARGHEVRLLASRIRHAPGPEPEYSAFGTDHPRAQVVAQTWNPSARAVLRAALSDFRPDVVHVRQFLWQLSPSILPLLADVPTVYHVSHYKAICPTATRMLPDGSPCRSPAGRVCMSRGCVTWRTWPFSMRQLALFERWRHVFTRIVVLSDAMARLLAEHDIGPALVVPNAVQARPARTRRSDRPLVSYAGRLARSKGVDVLIEAFAQVRSAIPEARLLVAGDGPESGSLRSLAIAMGLREHVEFCGHLPRSEMEARLEKTWVHVVPSRWDEPFGNVVTEAMVRGVPVVASEVGGVPEIVRNGTDGLLVPPGDPVALGNAIELLLREPPLAERMGAAARDRACTSFGEERLLDRMTRIFEDVVEAP